MLTEDGGRVVPILSVLLPRVVMICGMVEVSVFSLANTYHTVTGIPAAHCWARNSVHSATVPHVVDMILKNALVLSSNLIHSLVAEEIDDS